MERKLAGFNLIDLSTTNSVSVSIVPTIRITDSVVTFNKAFCNAVNLAKFVELYVDIEHSRIAFVGTEVQTKTCRKFYHQKSTAKKLKSVACVNWSGKKIRHVVDVSVKRKPGQKLKLIGEEQDGAIIFDYGVATDRENQHDEQ